MLFNSIEFALFLPIVFTIYWFVTNKNLALQNLFLLFASYFFYGWWDWRFLSLIFFSTCVDYGIGLYLGKDLEENKRKTLVITSVVVNIGLLALFKYYNFFAENFVHAFSLFGFHFDVARLNIILPIGISFYTFQTLSYSIDIYRRKFEPTKDFVSFAAFVSFFPQLVAGPIEKASNLLPQFHKKRIFQYDKAVDGMRQILWGLFKKIVIADNCAEFANLIFDTSADYSGSTLLLGAIFFVFQIYGDFSGYSDIAIGTARLLGFNLMQNFASPYFSKSVTEFWRRWHISLGTWINDYLFLPMTKILVGKYNKYGMVLGLISTFTIIGLWHGANWNFVVFGLLHGIILAFEFLTRKRRKKLKLKIGKVAHEFVGWALVLLFWIFTLIFFRAENINHAFNFLTTIFSTSLFTIPMFPRITIIPFILVFVLLEWVGRDEQYAIAKMGFKWKRPIRHCLYYAIIIAIFTYAGQVQQFIYFQF